MLQTQSLELILQKLKKNKSRKYKQKFLIPGLWLNQSNVSIEVNPYEFFIDSIEKIKSTIVNKKNSKEKRIYNMFVRLTTAFDHSCDNKIENFEGEFKDTGTFLKAISILPYIHRLGINTIYLLPITSIGEDAKKGTLGSPYAIKNPYKLDDNLSEPMLEMSIEDEFKAFSEAVHLLGMELVCEFVFRTASIDSDLTLEHPDWFYWINNRIKDRENGDTSESKYGPPIYLKKELEAIKKKVELSDFSNSIQPHEQFRRMFTETPKKVARVDGKIMGLLSDKKTEVRIPGAFADWPPDDNQPAWSDVTYLKLFDKNDFNYIAYNTIRMYDTELSKDVNAVKNLWNYISGIIPYYIKNYHIDGVMIDMGHALPTRLRKQIVSEALQVNEKFYFWEENFSVSSSSLHEGYSAVVGYLPFDVNNPYKMRELIRKFSKKEFPINFFGTGENHNTPRCYSRISSLEFLKSLYCINLFLPNYTFIHSGFEIAEANPVNTGLDFTSEQITEFPPEKLGLFSNISFNWNNTNIVDYIQSVNQLKSKFIIDEDDIHDTDVQLIDVNDNRLVGFFRRDKISMTEILIISNFSNDNIFQAEVLNMGGVSKVENLVTNITSDVVNDAIKIDFEPYQVKIYKLHY